MDRRWIIGSGPGAVWHPLDIFKNIFYLVGTWGYRFTQFQLGTKLFERFGVSWLDILSIVGVIVTVIGFMVYLSRRSDRTVGLLVWSVLQLLAYSIILPTRGHAGRYQPAVLVLMMFFFVMGLQYLWQKGCNRKAIVFDVVVLGALSCLSLYTWAVIVRGAIDQFNRVHIPAAMWLLRHSPPDAKVAAFDIGAMSYFGNRKIIDLGGLIDPKAGEALYKKTIPAYMKEKGADYLAMVFPYTHPETYFNSLDLNRLLREKVLKFRAEFVMPIDNPETYWPGDAARLLANKIRIYKVTWKPGR